MRNNGPAHASARKVKAVPDSTCEAETLMASKAAKDTVATRIVLQDVGYPVKGPTPLLGDNQATRDVIVMPGTSSRTRYFERATLIVKRLYMKYVVAPWLVPTKFMVADIFTKMLDRDAFFLCRSYLMNLDNAPSQMVPGRFAAMTRQWTRLLWSP